jgi:predicted DCC family thiol-disulfide oxidoreductase YuxK
MMRWLLMVTLLTAVALEGGAWVLGRRPTRSRIAPRRRLLVYDDDCGFCWGAALLIEGQVELELVPFSSLPVEGVLEELTDEQIHASAHYVTEDGIEYHGGESVTRLARLLPRGGEAAALLDLPVLRGLREIGYRLVSWQRARVSRLLGVG